MEQNHKKIQLNVYTASIAGGLKVSAADTRQVISATNNRAQYFAELAKKYKDEAKLHRDNAKYYAEQNSDVTFEYIDNVKNSLLSVIETKQPNGDYALRKELPQNVSELENDVGYSTKQELLKAVPSQENCEGRFLYTNGEESSWKGINSFSLFDTKLSDHALKGEESFGWALQGTYVYRNAIAGSRCGYPDFYAKCLEEYNNAENYLFESFKQPLLTSDGALGGDSFAVYTSSIYNDDNTYSAYKAFDGDNSTCWFCKNTPADLIFYNPIALKVSSLVLKNRPSGDNFHFTGGKVYGSNDNLDYIELARFTNTISTAGASYTIDVNSDSFYKYYKIAFETSSKAGCGLANISINAVEKPIFVKNSNGHIFYNIADKDIVDNYFNNMGSAWFYGVDTENERIFLPRNNYFDQATGDTSEVGKSIEAGLPDHTHNLTKGTTTQGYGNWSFATSGTHGNLNNAPTNKASVSNPIYGKSDTVQPNSVKKLLYICVGNTTNYECMTEVVNQGMEILEQVNQGIESRVKLDGSNAEFPLIIESYHNGSSWYNVYSNGLIEQGGLVTKGSSLAAGAYWTTTVEFLKPFNTNTYVALGVARADENIVSNANLCTHTKTATNMVIQTRNPNGSAAYANPQVDWYVKGY